jgi:uncharacterized protein (TIGR00730 family)
MPKPPLDAITRSDGAPDSNPELALPLPEPSGSASTVAPTGKFQQIHDEPTEERVAPGIEALVQQIHETADKLVRDGTSRADVKLVNTALKELRYSFKVFAAYRNVRKVAIFGSARMPASHPAYAECVEFSRRLAQLGYMVITGAASGIMEAGHVGAGRERSIGVNILLPFEQAANPVIRGDHKLMNLKYFFTRKLMFVKEADAVALFPGGFGTQDECWEVLTLVQTGKSHLFPIVMVDEPGGDYWKRWHVYVKEVLCDRGLICPEDLSLYRLCESVDEAVEEIRQFYRVYHSMRYVGPNLVLRLQTPLSDAALARIREEFRDIVVSGTFEQGGALPAEAGDTHLLHLTRLVFQFDRRRLGRLRQLIDAINRLGPAPPG